MFTCSGCILVVNPCPRCLSESDRFWCLPLRSGWLCTQAGRVVSSIFVRFSCQWIVILECCSSGKECCWGFVLVCFLFFNSTSTRHTRSLKEQKTSCWSFSVCMFLLCTLVQLFGALLVSFGCASIGGFDAGEASGNNVRVRWLWVSKQNVNISLLPHVSFSGWASWPRALFGTILLQLHDSPCSGRGGLHRLSYPQDLSLEVPEWSHRTFFFKKRTSKSEWILDSAPSVLLRPLLDCVLTSSKNNELVHAVRQWYILFVIIISERRLISEWKMCVVCQVYMKYYYYGSRVECGMQMIVCRSPTAESLSGLYAGLWPRILSHGSSYLLV